MGSDRFYNIERLNQIINDRKDGMKYEDLLEKYDTNPSTLNKIFKANNLQRHMVAITEVKKFLKIEDNKMTKRPDGESLSVFLVACSCGEKSWIPYFVASRLFKAKRKYLCDKCSTSFSVRIERASGQRKRKDNTTGYIGIHVRKESRNNDIWGYQATIMSKKKAVMRNRYKDPDLNEKTLLQAVVDRDMYIVQHNLTHRRNLSDKELIGNMLMLGYEQVEDVKQRLENKVL